MTLRRHEINAGHVVRELSNVSQVRATLRHTHTLSLCLVLDARTGPVGHLRSIARPSEWGRPVFANC